MKRHLIIASISLMGIASAPAHAGYTTFFGEDFNGSQTVPLLSYAAATGARTNFLSSLTGVGTENFESQAGSAPLALTFPGAGTATLTGSGSVASVTSGSTNGFGRYATSGTNYWEEEAGGGFSFLFSQSIAAFGFFGVDVGDFDGTVQLRISGTNGIIDTITVPHSSGSQMNGSVVYFGLIGQTVADQFNKIEFLTTTGNGDFFAFDDMTIGSREQVCTGNCGNTVPEPGSLPLLVGALAAMAALRRRRVF